MGWGCWILCLCFAHIVKWNILQNYLILFSCTVLSLNTLFHLKAPIVEFNVNS